MHKKVLRENINICVLEGLKKSANKFNVNVHHIESNFFQFKNDERFFILNCILSELETKFENFNSDSTKFVEKYSLENINFKSHDLVKWFEKSNWFCEYLAISKLKKFGNIDFDKESNLISGLRNVHKFDDSKKHFGEIFVDILSTEMNYFVGQENRLSKRPKGYSFDKIRGCVYAYGYEFKICYAFPNSAIFEIKKRNYQKQKIDLNDLLNGFKKLFDVMECVGSTKVSNDSILINFFKKTYSEEKTHSKNNDLALYHINQKLNDIKESLNEISNDIVLTEKHLNNLKFKKLKIEDDYAILLKAVDVLNN